MIDLLVVGDVNPDVVLSGVPADLPWGQRERLVDVTGCVVDPEVATAQTVVACGALSTRATGRTAAQPTWEEAHA